MRSFLSRVISLCLLVLSGCALKDAETAARGKRALIGMKEVDLEACLGSPDQHTSFPGTDVLTYYASSSFSLSFSPPVVGGFAVSNGGYCHITIRVDDGIVSHVIYSGEKNAAAARDAYCAPILDSCLGELDAQSSRHGG